MTPHTQAVRDALAVLAAHGWDVRQQRVHGTLVGGGGGLVAADYTVDGIAYAATVARSPWRPDPPPAPRATDRVAPEHVWRAWLARQTGADRFVRNLPDPDAAVCGAVPAPADVPAGYVTTPCLRPAHRTPAGVGTTVHGGARFMPPEDGARERAWEPWTWLGHVEPR